MIFRKHKKSRRRNAVRLLITVILTLTPAGCGGSDVPGLIGEADIYIAEDEASDTPSDVISDVSADVITNVPTDMITDATSDGPSDAISPLHVSGTQLADKDGNIIDLRGVSTHGIAWYPEYINYDAFRTLRDDWGANMIRLALYTQEEGGYLSGGNRSAQLRLIDDGVRYATKLGMYVIIDWHILSDGNPYMHRDEAIAFFSEMSAKYADRSNVIYEICNEPQGSPWESVIRPYAEEIIPAIRQNAPDSIILVGTNTWSQDVDEVIGHSLDDPNVMYVLHFYASSHGDELRKKLTLALEAGLPIFISECSICDYSGSGSIDYTSANQWFSIIENRHIPYAVWNLSNKNESSALVRPDCAKLSDWNETELSATGQWFRARMREEADRDQR